jgi:hypothetical protein
MDGPLTRNRLAYLKDRRTKLDPAALAGAGAGHAGLRVAERGGPTSAHLVH